jgi:hypothetical protein
MAISADRYSADRFREAVAEFVNALLRRRHDMVRLGSTPLQPLWQKVSLDPLGNT